MSLLNEIIHVFIQMAPYLMFGFLFAGILHVLIKKDMIVKHLGKNSGGAVIKASLFGVPLPLCSCSVIPTAISLKKNGASNASVLSFLLSTPLTGVDSIIATYGFLGPVFGVFRPISAFFIGIFGGISALFINTEKPAIPEDPINEKSCCCNSNCETQEHENKTNNVFEKINNIFEHAFKTLLDDITLPLVIGIVISGFISWLIPDNYFADLNVPVLVQMLAMIVVGIPLYICATSSLPIGAALLLKGLSPGVVFVLLVAGPATNSATVALIVKQFGKKFFILYFAAISILSMGFGLLLDKIISIYNFSINIGLDKHGEHEQTILLNISAIIFLLLILLSIKRRFFRKGS